MDRSDMSIKFTDIDQSDKSVRCYGNIRHLLPTNKRVVKIQLHYRLSRFLGYINKMVLRCAWGTCNADERYPERLEGGCFIRFPTPKRDLEKVKRWIKACGRPHEQLNIARINQHKAVCSKHFVGGNGPSENYPDPIQADGSRTMPVRKLPVKRASSQQIKTSQHKHKCLHLEEDITTLNSPDMNCDLESGVSTQTEHTWISALDMLAVAAENHDLRLKLSDSLREIQELQLIVSSKDNEIQHLKKTIAKKQTLSVEIVKCKENTLKNLFKYYTGITYIRFVALLTFLAPIECPVKYGPGRRDTKSLSQEDGLFLTICRLRHGFGLKDLATRFGVSTQSAGVVFNTWLDLLYLKLGQLSIWPNRDTIIKNMPSEYRKDFPTTIIIIDGTEVKTQIPSALCLQSQLYSDYKSSTTLKGLIGCDPNGCVMFVSELFTGSISDKSITEQSGFYDLLKTLKSVGYIKEGDAIMVDKGFNIAKEINELGLKINIPPFASASRQMTASETLLTNKIAKHRVHIERLICKVKTYKLLSHCIPTSLFQKANKIWTVCCLLTLFQDVFVKDE